jgi:hypothetical protein
VLSHVCAHNIDTAEKFALFREYGFGVDAEIFQCVDPCGEVVVALVRGAAFH